MFLCDAAEKVGNPSMKDDICLKFPTKVMKCKIFHILLHIFFQVLKCNDYGYIIII